MDSSSKDFVDFTTVLNFLLRPWSCCCFWCIFIDNSLSSTVVLVSDPNFPRVSKQYLLGEALWLHRWWWMLHDSVKNNSVFRGRTLCRDFVWLCITVFVGVGDTACPWKWLCIRVILAIGCGQVRLSMTDCETLFQPVKQTFQTENSSAVRKIALQKLWNKPGGNQKANQISR